MDYREDKRFVRLMGVIEEMGKSPTGLRAEEVEEFGKRLKKDITLLAEDLEEQVYHGELLYAHKNKLYNAVCEATSVRGVDLDNQDHEPSVEVMHECWSAVRAIQQRMR